MSERQQNHLFAESKQRVRVHTWEWKEKEEQIRSSAQLRAIDMPIKKTGAPHNRSWKLDTELAKLIARMVLAGEIEEPEYEYFPNRKFLTLSGYSKAVALHYFTFLSETGYRSNTARLPTSLRYMIEQRPYSVSPDYIEWVVKKGASKRLSEIRSGKSNFGPKFVSICAKQLQASGWKRRRPRNSNARYRKQTVTIRRGVFNEKIEDTSYCWYFGKETKFNTTRVREYKEFRLADDTDEDEVRRVMTEVEMGWLTLCNGCDTFFTYRPQQYWCKECARINRNTKAKEARKRRNAE